MVSRRKRARLRYLRELHKRYLHMETSNGSTYGSLPRFSFMDAALLETDSDELQDYLVEARISELQATICVKNGFCSGCQHMLDNWPALESQTKDQPLSVRLYDTLSMEAAARSGCEFCACVLQSLLDRLSLDLYRKVELRFRNLQACGASSLVIGRWGVDDIRTLRS
jgi:hypothetical protein